MKWGVGNLAGGRAKTCAPGYELAGGGVPQARGWQAKGVSVRQHGVCASPALTCSAIVLQILRALWQSSTQACEDSPLTSPCPCPRQPPSAPPIIPMLPPSSASRGEASPADAGGTSSGLRRQQWSTPLRRKVQAWEAGQLRDLHGVAAWGAGGGRYAGLSCSGDMMSSCSLASPVGMDSLCARATLLRRQQLGEKQLVQAVTVLVYNFV